MSQGVGAVKYIVAVASGKGGVVSRRLSKPRCGYRAAWYQVAFSMRTSMASQARLLGIADGVMPDVIEEKIFIPIEAHGVSAMSMAFLTERPWCGVDRWRVVPYSR